MNNLLKNRDILSKITAQLDNNLVLILIGARQVGKTFILKALIEYLKNKHSENKVLYFDLEKPDILDNFSDYNSILNFLLAKGIEKNKKNFILLDEFQKMPTPTKTLKILHDNYPFIKIIATGSSSLDIYRKLRDESMAGRKRIFDVYTLDFAEFLDFSGAAGACQTFSRVIDRDIDPKTIVSEVGPLFEQFAVYGGYPKAALSGSDDEKKEVLSEIYRSYVNRDVVGFLGVEDGAKFNKLTSLLAVQAGSLFNLNEISKITGISRHMLEKYLFVLENTFIVKTISPFYTNKQKEIVKMPKIYFMDTGLRNWTIRNFNALNLRDDAGNIIENTVLMEMLKYLSVDGEIKFWRTPQGAEVDFVVMLGSDIVPVEVKYTVFFKAVVPSGLKAFIREYRPKKAFVLTKDFYEKTDFEKCEVFFMPAFLAKKILI